MPAGDLLTTHTQIELRGLLMGEGTKYQIAPPGIQGIGAVKAKSNDVPLDEADGSYAPPDYRDVRVITWPLNLLGDDEEDALDLLDALVIAFEPGDDEELHMLLPGRHIYFVGRPRAADEDMGLLYTGAHIFVLCSFTALSPARHTVP